MERDDKMIKTLKVKRAYLVEVHESVIIEDEDLYMTASPFGIKFNREILIIGSTSKEIIDLIGEDNILAIRKFDTATFTK